MIGTDGGRERERERESVKFVLLARLDDDDIYDSCPNVYGY